MKFLNGVMVGSLITAGAMLICSESVDSSKKRIVRKGKQFARKIGMIRIQQSLTIDKK